MDRGSSWMDISSFRIGPWHVETLRVSAVLICIPFFGIHGGTIVRWTVCAYCEEDETHPRRRDSLILRILYLAIRGCGAGTKSRDPKEKTSKRDSCN